MKIYAVRDEAEREPRKDLAYLIYYESEKCFYVELPEDADKWETPLLLSSFAERGIRTVGAYYSMLWVRQRVIAPDRQNLIPKEKGELLVFFRDGSVKRCDMGELTGDDRRFSAIRNRWELFGAVRVAVGGYELSWGENLTVADFVLYDRGKEYNFKLDDFERFAAHCLVNTSGAAQILNCSRQYVNDLISEGRLRVVRRDSRNKLFLKSEVMKCRWK